MNKVTYNSGDKYGDIKLTGKSYIKNRKRYVEFVCCCGKINWGRLDSIKRNRIKSCGCRISKYGTVGVSQRAAPKHGQSSHPLYKIWVTMRQRCNNSKARGYKNYGGRGICVYKEWDMCFSVFYQWSIGNGWQHNLSLDRVDNNKGYSPENCRWATSLVQARNRRSTVMINAFGETKCISDWYIDKRCVVSRNTIMRRVNGFGWTTEKAITTQVTPTKRVNGRFIDTHKIL